MKIHESGDISRVTKEQLEDVLLGLDERQIKNCFDATKGLFAYEEARKKAERIRAVCECKDSTFDDALEAIAKEGEITPFIALHLALGTVRANAKESEQNIANAKKKGEIWRQAAIEQYNDPEMNQSKSLPDFATTIAGAPLTTQDGRKEKAPNYRTVYNFMLDARKKGKLKP